jgi:hypothetical protein
MKIQAFIFNWPGRKQHAVQLEAMFRPYCAVAVINSDDSLKIRYPHWHHVGNDAHFTDQWNAARARFNADVFLHVQADVWPDRFALMLSEYIECLITPGVGVLYSKRQFQGFDNGASDQLRLYATNAVQQTIPSTTQLVGPSAEPRVVRGSVAWEVTGFAAGGRVMLPIRG